MRRLANPVPCIRGNPAIASGACIHTRPSFPGPPVIPAKAGSHQFARCRYPYPAAISPPARHSRESGNLGIRPAPVSKPGCHSPESGNPSIRPAPVSIPGRHFPVRPSFPRKQESRDPPGVGIPARPSFLRKRESRDPPRASIQARPSFPRKRKCSYPSGIGIQARPSFPQKRESINSPGPGIPAPPSFPRKRESRDPPGAVSQLGRHSRESGNPSICPAPASAPGVIPAKAGIQSARGLRRPLPAPHSQFRPSALPYRRPIRYNSPGYDFGGEL